MNGDERDEGVGTVTTLADLDTALRQAEERHHSAVIAADDANRERVSALNVLNRAQQEFDTAATTRREQAHRETDWGLKRQEKKRGG